MSTLTDSEIFTVITESTFVVTSTDKKLNAKIWSPQIAGKRPAILMVHGWRSSMDTYETLAPKLAERGFVVLAFNMSGHGVEDGKPEDQSPAEYLREVMDASDNLANHPNVDEYNMSVVGTSFGGYLATMLANYRTIRNLVLRAPSLYMDKHLNLKGLKGDDAEVILWRSVVRETDDAQALSALSRFRGRLLLVESEKDETVPKSVIQSYADAASKSDVLWYTLRDAGHRLSSDPEAKEKFEQVVVDWITPK